MVQLWVKHTLVVRCVGANSRTGNHLSGMDGRVDGLRCSGHVAQRDNLTQWDNLVDSSSQVSTYRRAVRLSPHFWHPVHAGLLGAGLPGSQVSKKSLAFPHVHLDKRH